MVDRRSCGPDEGEEAEDEVRKEEVGEDKERDERGIGGALDRAEDVGQEEVEIKEEEGKPGLEGGGSGGVVDKEAEGRGEEDGEEGGEEGDGLGGDALEVADVEGGEVVLLGTVNDELPEGE